MSKPVTNCARIRRAGLLAGLFAGVAFSSNAQDATPTPDESLPPPPLETVQVTDDRPFHEERVSAVEAYLANLRSLQARFVQQNPGGGMVSGTLSLERPGKVRFEYDDDIQVLIVADGKTLNMIDYEVGEITKWPVKDTPLAILVERDLALDENVSILTAGPGALGNMVSMTAEDPKKPELGVMTLVFSVNDDGAEAPELTLRLWQVVDPQGGITTVTLQETILNAELDEKLWTFDDPRGERFERRRRN